MNILELGVDHLYKNPTSGLTSGPPSGFRSSDLHPLGDLPLGKPPSGSPTSYGCELILLGC
jgi:hypothetical protein